jgi:hypothetical protein
MSQTRSALISQFKRDIQALRDALIGLSDTQLDDPTFNGNTTLRERLSVIAAHYYRLGESVAFRMGRQGDKPLEEDATWHKEAVEWREEWPLSALQEDLEDAWEFYREMLYALSDDELEWFVRHIEGALTRPALETSREITAWRLSG